mgnify:CR=1 FL=1
MAPYLGQVSLQGDSGLPTDRFVNTWHMTDTDGADFVTAMFNFYEALGPYIGTTVGRGDNHGHTVKVFDLADPEPRVPIHVENDFYFGGAVPSAANLPTEVAACLSFHSGYESGAVNARRRNRVFIGPLNLSTVADDAFDSPRPSSGFITDLLDAAEALFELGAPLMATYSPTDNAARWPVVLAWVDNAFDTQRRRGPDPTTRVTRVIG